MERQAVVDACFIPRIYPGQGGPDCSSVPGWMRQPRRDIYEWLMSHVGPREGQVFKVDRVYYPDEDRPDLRSGWQATAAFWPSDAPRWNIVASRPHSITEDTIIMPLDQAVEFKLTFGGELIEL